MEIKTINNEIINTDKLSDMNSEMIETMEKSGIRDLAIKYDGLCYMICALPKTKTWSIMHLNSPDKVGFFLQCIDSFIRNVYGNKMKMVIVPNDENENQNKV